MRWRTLATRVQERIQASRTTTSVSSFFTPSTVWDVTFAAPRPNSNPQEKEEEEIHEITVVMPLRGGFDLSWTAGSRVRTWLHLITGSARSILTTNILSLKWTAIYFQPTNLGSPPFRYWNSCKKGWRQSNVGTEKSCTVSQVEQSEKDSEGDPSHSAQERIN